MLEPATHQDNNLTPVSLEHLQDLIDRVSERYPFIDKTQIVLIIRSFFETTRDVLVSGNLLSINGLFSNIHLISFYKSRKNKIFKLIKVKLSTPEKFKNG